MRHVHSRDGRKKLAQDFLRARAGLAHGIGKVTLMKYDPTDGFVMGRVLRKETDYEREERIRAAGIQGAKRLWVILGTFAGFADFMKGCQGEVLPHVRQFEAMTAEEFLRRPMGN
jgi:hypothetical protein